MAVTRVFDKQVSALVRGDQKEWLATRMEQAEVGEAHLVRLALDLARDELLSLPDGVLRDVIGQMGVGVNGAEALSRHPFKN